MWWLCHQPVSIRLAQRLPSCLAKQDFWVASEDASEWNKHFELVLKAECPPQCGWASPNPLRAWTEQKTGGEPAYCRTVGPGTRVLPGSWTATHTIRPRASQAFGLRLNHTTGFPGSPTRRGQTVGHLSLHNCMRQLLIINLYVHPTGSVSL